MSIKIKGSAGEYIIDNEYDNVSLSLPNSAKILFWAENKKELDSIINVLESALPDVLHLERQSKPGLKVLSALVIQNKICINDCIGSETVVLTLDATTLSATGQIVDKHPHLTMQVEIGMGVQWVKDNLGLEPEIRVRD
jgi:hypothetical protein